jgi:hypothetical protein
MDNACVAINVPANGYLSESAYGSGWACNRGYRADGGSIDSLLLLTRRSLPSAGLRWN